jgi:hypothetical protein
MKLLAKGPWQPVDLHPDWRKRQVRYRATFWDGERHCDRDCDDILYDEAGHFAFLNTSRNVSYFAALVAAVR